MKAFGLVLVGALSLAGGCVTDNTSGGEISSSGGSATVRFEDAFFSRRLEFESASLIPADSG